MVLILLILGGLIMGPLLGFMDTGVKAGQTHEALSSRLYAADSGVDDGIHWIIMGKQTEDWPWAGNETVGWQRDTYIINESSVNVTVQPREDLSHNFHEITSTATSADGRTTVLSTVWAAAEPLTIEGFDDLGTGEVWDGDAYIDGDGVLKAQRGITGNVYVTGKLTLHDQTEVGGSVFVGGDFEQKGKSSVVHGNVCCHGNVTIKQPSAIVEGDIYMTVDGSQEIEIWGTAGDIYVDGSGTVTISLYPQASVGYIYIYAGVTFLEGAPFNDSAYQAIVDWDGSEPPPPDCPDIPVAGSRILTYEIL